jgi:hypothetical protein
LAGAGAMGTRSRLAELEAAGHEPDSPELLVSLAWLTIPALRIDEHDLNATRRRAMFVLAAGGDPNRDLDLDSVAAERLADELDTPEHREAMARALAELETEGLPRVAEAVGLLLAEPDLAWRILALALLADELAGE